MLTHVVEVISSNGEKYGLKEGSVPDIEVVVGAVQMLAERDRLELAPFVDEWEPLLVESGGPQLGYAADGTPIDLSPTGVLKDLLNAVTGLLRKLLAVSNGESLDYLAPLVELGSDDLVSIATLNYDRTIEISSDRFGIPCSEGLDTWNEESELTWAEAGVKLMKLHGSITWGRDYKLATGLNMGQEQVTRSPESPTIEELPPFVVFGTAQKLRPEGPFLDLRAEFINDLRDCAHLVVIGYGFGDEHVNVIIRRWLNADKRRVLTIVDPYFPDTWITAAPFEFEMITGLQYQATALIQDIRESRLSVIREPGKYAIPRVCKGSAALDEELAAWLASRPRGEGLPENARH